MRQQKDIFFIPWRFYFVMTFILFISCLLILRILDLAILKRNFLLNQGDARAVRVISQPSFRGMITDRNGNPLAISTSVFSVWINPQEFFPNGKEINELSQLLKINSNIIKKMLSKYLNTEREFVYLKRELSPEIAHKIKSLNIYGVYIQETYKRFYPEADMTAHVIGFTDVDDKGQEGLELIYDKWLTGRPGKKLVLKDRLGRVMSEIQQIQDQAPGNDLALSIDRRIQYIAYRELVNAVDLNKAESGSVVVMDIKTGEILAMVNQPSFNPNSNEGSVDAFRNRAVTDVFEPGSTIKAFSIASALDSGLYKPTSVVDTYPGWLRVGKNLVHDEHNNGVLSIEEILQKSSNVGNTKIVLSLPPNHLRKILSRVGFGSMTGVGFPGERSGELVLQDNKNPFALATLGFGYGLSVTTLQLAQAYAILGNNGLKVTPSLLRVNKKVKTTQVLNEKVAKQMLVLLESVTEKGGGRKARVEGYKVAGKSGTAWLLGSHGYDKHRYLSSFVGLAPASAPRFVVAVVVRDPKGKHFLGSYVAGPVFKAIMDGTLHAYNVAPDVITTDQVLLTAK